MHHSVYKLLIELGDQVFVLIWFALGLILDPGVRKLESLEANNPAPCYLLDFPLFFARRG